MRRTTRNGSRNDGGNSRARIKSATERRTVGNVLRTFPRSAPSSPRASTAQEEDDRRKSTGQKLSKGKTEDALAVESKYKRLKGIGDVAFEKSKKSITLADACKFLHLFGLYGPCLASTCSRSRNLAFSPFMTKVMLYALLEGVRRSAETDILVALGLREVDRADVAKIKAKVSLKVHTYDSSKDGLGAVRFWNGIYIYGLLRSKPQYVETIESQYLCNKYMLDFERNDPRDIVMILNSGPAEKSDVPDCFHISDIKPSSRVVLGSTAHFKCVWQLKFTVKNGPFTTLTDGVKDVPLMTTHGRFTTFSMPDIKMRAVEIPFARDRLCLIVILPNDPKEFGILESMVRDPRVDILKCAKGMESQPLRLTIPKMTISTRVNMRNALQSIGLRSLFSRSDLTGMLIEDPGCGISTIIHKTVIKLDPEGTLDAKEIDNARVFACNRPFVYFIKDRRSATFLACGRVVEP